MTLKWTKNLNLFFNISDLGAKRTKIPNLLSRTFQLSHLHHVQKVSLICAVCARACVCVCVYVREKWAKAPPHSKSERKKGKAN